jgi:hypothetical protein
MFVMLGLVYRECAVTVESTPGNAASGATTASEAITPPSAIATPAPPSWRWRLAAFLLAGAAQLITIAALLSTSPIPATWSALLMAIAPALLAAAAAFGPAPVNFPAASAGVGVLVAGIVGEMAHTGPFFIPALVALAVGGFKLWQEQSSVRKDA